MAVNHHDNNTLFRNTCHTHTHTYIKKEFPAQLPHTDYGNLQLCEIDPISFSFAGALMDHISLQLYFVFAHSSDWEMSRIT